MASTRKPRTDANANRQHIVRVAVEAFAVDGLDLPMREIARRAGLGVATLFRHFETRETLVGTVLAEPVALCQAQMQEALQDPDPWRAFCKVIDQFATHQIHNRAINEALLGGHEASAAFEAQRVVHAKAMEALVGRAKDAGAIRADLTFADIRVGLSAIAALKVPPSDPQGSSVRRLAALLKAGMARVA